MRRLTWLLLALTGCAGADSDPVEVAERFHAFRVEGDDRSLHALLTGPDRAAVPLDRFPIGLPPRATLDLFGWTQTRLDSARLLDRSNDTASVLLFVAGPQTDTVRLVATRVPRGLPLVQLDRVTWRVTLGLAEHGRLEALATALRDHERGSDAAAVERAAAYLAAADSFPHLARPGDRAAAQAILRRAAVAEALGVDLRVASSFTGTPFVEGRVVNRARTRVATLTLVVRDVAGEEERVEMWDLPPGSSTPVHQLTRLEPGPLRHRLEWIQVF